MPTSWKHHHNPPWWSLGVLTTMNKRKEEREVAGEEERKNTEETYDLVWSFVVTTTKSPHDAHKMVSRIVVGFQLQVSTARSLSLTIAGCPNLAQTSRVELVYCGFPVGEDHIENLGFNRKRVRVFAENWTLIIVIKPAGNTIYGAQEDEDFLGSMKIVMDERGTVDDVVPWLANESGTLKGIKRQSDKDIGYAIFRKIRNRIQLLLISHAVKIGLSEWTDLGIFGRGVNEPSRARIPPSSARARLSCCRLELELGSFKVWYSSSSSAREKCKKLELGSARLVYLSSLNEPWLGSSSFMLFELD
ncbi:hypothetical protein LXL04_011001 [Taraxacum kok-saghyz]